MKQKQETKPKDGQSQKEKESKVVKFKRVCTPRLRKALKAIKLIGNCSTKDYAYNQEQVQKILHSLIEAVGTVEKQFSGTNAEESAVEL